MTSIAPGMAAARLTAPVLLRWRALPPSMGSDDPS